jgi:hypothetical protein
MADILLEGEVEALHDPQMIAVYGGQILCGEEGCEQPADAAFVRIDGEEVCFAWRCYACLAEVRQQLIHEEMVPDSQ